MQILSFAASANPVLTSFSIIATLVAGAPSPLRSPSSAPAFTIASRCLQSASLTALSYAVDLRCCSSLRGYDRMNDDYNVVIRQSLMFIPVTFCLCLLYLRMRSGSVTASLKNLLILLKNALRYMPSLLSKLYSGLQFFSVK